MDIATLELLSNVALVVADGQESCVGFDLVTWRRKGKRERSGWSQSRP